MSTPTRADVILAAAGLALALALAACDDKSPAPKTSPSSTPTTAPPAASSAPPKENESPKPLQLAVDDSAVYVSGERFELAVGDAKGRIAAALANKAVANQEIVVEASREAKVPKVATLLASLATAGVKSAKVRTPKRDRAPAEVTFAVGAKHSGCEAVGFIAKDSAINAWPASGASALRFTRGMAGPDLTRGSEGVKKLAAACDAQTWAVSGDENVTWGLVFDLVLAVTATEDAGAPMKAKNVSLLSKTPTPGRKIEDD